MFHGLLDGERDCRRCGRQAFDLADEGDKATLKAFRRAALNSRARTFACFGAVVGSAWQSVFVFAAIGYLDFFILSPGTMMGAVVGAAFARLVRPLSQHRLDARLKS